MLKSLLLLLSFVFCSPVFAGQAITGNLTVSGNTGLGTVTPYSTAVLYVNGNVGIGSTNAGQVLDLQGSGRASTSFISPLYIGGSAVTQNLTLQSTSGVGTTDSISLNVGNNGATNGLTIINSGNVGIGSASPGAKFDIKGHGRVTGTNFFGFGNNDPGSNLTGFYNSTGSNTTGSLILDTNNTDRVFFTAGGNVGVNTSLPGVKLDVNGDIRATGTNHIVVGNDNLDYIANSSGTGSMQFTSGNSLTMTLSGGNVGIGTITPGQKIDISGGARIVSTNQFFFGSDNKADIEASAATTPDLLFKTNSAEVMRVTNGANVGIGSTAPGFKLDVGTGGIRVVSGNVAIGTSNATHVLEVLGADIYLTNGSSTQITAKSTVTNNRPSFIAQNSAGNQFLMTQVGSAQNLSFMSQTVNSDGILQNDNNLWISAGAGQTSAGTENIIFGTNNAPVVGIDANGNVGIGTWATGAIKGKLIVTSGNIGFGTTTPQSFFSVLGNVGIGTWTAVGGSLIVNGGGNVGISSAWPGNTLDVTGTLRTSGTVTPADIQLVENKSILMDAVLSADGKWSAVSAEAGTLGETVAFGEFVYLKTSDSQWYKTDADVDSTSGAVKVGICVVAGNDNDPTTIMFIGKINAASLFPTLTVGVPVYLSTTAGAVQVAQPSGTDDVVRIIGYGNTGDELYVNISDDYWTHT